MLGLLGMLLLLLLTINYFFESDIYYTAYIQTPNETEYENNKYINLNCTWNESEIQFIDCNSSLKLRHKLPPYLISFEGSGNTYTRLIIELILKHYTGSIHGADAPLRMAGFKGDDHCDDSVIILKAHAYHYLDKEWNEFMNGTSVNNRKVWFSWCRRLRSSNKKWIRRCNDNEPVMNAIFLVRNPWNSMFAEYQRERSIFLIRKLRKRQRKQNKTVNISMPNAHVANILKSQFDAVWFSKMMYIWSKRYIQILDIYGMFKELGREILLIRFEDIHDEIWKIVKFLIKKEYLQQHLFLYRQRIECLINDSKLDFLPRTEDIKRKKVKELKDSHLYMTKEYAYSKVKESILCHVWNIFHT